MTRIVKPRWFVALLACLVPTIVAAARPPRGDAPMRSATTSETVFRHYL